MSTFIIARALHSDGIVKIKILLVAYQAISWFLVSLHGLQITHSFLLESRRQSLNRWRYTGLVGNLSFDPEILII